MDVIAYLTLVPVMVSAVGDYCPYENNDLTTIPAGHFLTGLESIDFELNPITTIDEDAFNDVAESLTELLFTQALFTELPRAFLKLNSLQRLIIGDTKITTYDDDVVKHIGQTLQTLLMSNVGLTSWPSWIQYLTHLSTLSLANMIFKIPDNALDNQTSTMFSVNFENCSLTDIPTALFKLYELQYLVLDSNNFVNLTTSPYWTKINTLSLDKNHISDAAQLSKELLHIAGSLQILQLRENKLTSVPDLSAMTSLNSVFLTQNVISYVGAGKMPSSLQSLLLDNNYLTSLYSFMRSGVSLSKIGFHSNLITEINGVDIPACVTDMDVSFNLISQLSDTSFPENSNMETLTLDGNPISDVSKSAFKNLQKLSFLSLMATRITRLPVAMGALLSLRVADLDRNPNLICTCLETGLRHWFISQQVEVNGDCGLTSIVNFLNILSEGCPA